MTSSLPPSAPFSSPRSVLPVVSTFSKITLNHIFFLFIDSHGDIRKNVAKEFSPQDTNGRTISHLNCHSFPHCPPPLMSWRLVSRGEPTIFSDEGDIPVCYLRKHGKQWFTGRVYKLVVKRTILGRVCTFSKMERFTAIVVIVYLFSALSTVKGSRQGGDKVILNGSNEGCGPKFIFKSGTKRHKEFFIVCKEDPKIVRPQIKLLPMFEPLKSKKHTYEYHHYVEPYGHQISSQYHLPLESNQRPRWLAPSNEHFMQKFLASKLGPFYRPQ